MKNTDKKSYYAVIPADVRYDESIPAGAKLLYGEITALCNEKGFCWASNSYFANLYQNTGKTISRWVAQLIEKGYIQSHVDKEKGNQRQLYLSQSITLPMDKNVHTYGQKCPYPMDKNVHTLRTKMSIPMDKNVHHNNKDNTTVNNTDNKRKPSKVDLSLEAEQHAAFTLLLCRGVNEQVAQPLIFEQKHSLTIIEEVVKNGLAKEEEAKRTGGKFRLEAGYIVQSLNQARKEGKAVGATKLSKKLSARISLNKRKYTPLETKEFEKRKRRAIAALKAPK